MKLKDIKDQSLAPKGRPEINDGVNWYTLALEYDLQIDPDIYALLQALNDEVL
jgi:hypothetical protein